ncbi:membrane dipeptidase [Lysobacter sp. yr284]|uniref:dipeptidase n=1 Tax=Lysobacter TaxID=68 RepID=UPI000897D1D6|nr:membrane dipeptidase [Lysobacter sp. yr284]SDZ30086.1 membrane dipeptidase [Lysobacter sp. yr284]
MPDRRSFLIQTALAGAGALVAGAAGPLRAATAAAELRWAPFAEAMVVDACGFLGDDEAKVGDPLTPKLIADARASGLRVLQTTVGPVAQYEGAFEATVRDIAAWEDEIARRPDVFLAVRSGADLERARREKKLGVVYQFQDSAPIGEKLERIDDYHRLGLRTVQLTYNVRNLAGDGCLEPGDAGLSKFGHSLVERLNQRRILVDLAHSGRRTALEAIAASKSPVLISHTGCAALVERPRNKTDAELRACAQRGGVIGIYLMPFLRETGQPGAADVIRHLEHAIQVCGEDHVGIGTDNLVSAVKLTEAYKRDHAESIRERRKLGISAPGEAEDVYLYVEGLNAPRRFETLAALLSARGHSDARIGKILGGNFARVMAEVWG